MGCVQTKPSAAESPTRGIERMKLQHGYEAKDGSSQLGKAGGRREQADRGSGGRSAVVPTSDAAGAGEVVDVGENAGGGDGDAVLEEKVGSGGRGGGAAAVQLPMFDPPRPEGSQQGGAADETVDGWPKWLTENVPPEVLVGLVPKSADSYDKIAKIGQGTYSNVYKARDRETGKIVALKKVRFETSDSESVKFMAREIMILQKLDHPNVVKLEGLATSRMHYSLYLVFDFMPTDLTRVICGSDRRLTEPQVKCYMQQLLAGLQHCHEMGILHRDIKGSNLLIDRHGVLKIADFGLANTFSPNQRRPLTSRVVTLWYRAPELLFGATDYGIGIDLWSAGCLLAEMFAGRPIIPGRTEIEQIHRICKLCGSPPDDYWKRLKLNTNYRPAQPCKPSYLESFRDFPAQSLGLLTTLLDLEPTRRGSAASALQNEFFSTFPLACDLSGLPVTYKEEYEPPMQTITRKKNKSSKHKRLPSKPKDKTSDKQRDEYTSSKEVKKSMEDITHVQETGSNAGSVSSLVKTDIRDTTDIPFLSPTGPDFSNESSPRTEGHPRAIKNVKNRPPLAPKPNISAKGGERLTFQLDRSTSTTEFRRLEGHTYTMRFKTNLHEP